MGLPKVACDTCIERPDGCWKAVDYNCTRCYGDAKKKAVTQYLCPLYLLTPFKVDRTVVINLKRRADLRKRGENELSKWNSAWDKPTWFDAIDGWGNPEYPKSYTTGKGAWGCRMSHLQVLQQALTDNVQSLFVLEGDFLLDNEFSKLSNDFFKNVPADWELVYLGGQHIRKSTKVNDQVVRVQSLVRTHAYIARPSAQQKLYDFWSSLTRGHIDNELARHLKEFKCYAPTRFIVGQGGTKSDIVCRVVNRRWWTPPKVIAPPPMTDQDWRDQRIVLVRGTRRPVYPLVKSKTCTVPVDVLYTCYLNSHDRIDYLNTTADFLHKHLKYDGPMKFTLSLEHHQSDGWLSEVEEFCNKRDINFMMRPEGSVPSLGAHLDWILPQLRSDLILNAQDDWKLLRDLDLTPYARKLIDNSNLGMYRFRGNRPDDPNTGKQEFFEKGDMLFASKKSKWCVHYQPALWHKRIYSAVAPLYCGDYPRASEKRFYEKFQRTKLDVAIDPMVTIDYGYWFKHIGVKSAFSKPKVISPTASVEVVVKPKVISPTASVEVVVSHWKRPSNVVKIADALRKQDYPVTITVVDTDQPGYALPADLPVDNHHVVSDAGAYTRYLPFQHFKKDYTLFLDDDLLPDPNLVSHFLQCSEYHPNDVLSCFGRIFKEKYNYHSIKRTGEFQEITMPIRMYWVPTNYIQIIDKVYQAWVESGHSKIFLDDDVLMARALQPNCKFYVVPAGPGCVNLSEPFPACDRTPDRLNVRTRTWQVCGELVRILRQQAT